MTFSTGILIVIVPLIIALAWRLYRVNKAGQFWCDGFYLLLDEAVDTNTYRVRVPVDVYNGKCTVEKKVCD